MMMRGALSKRPDLDDDDARNDDGGAFLTHNVVILDPPPTGEGHVGTIAADKRCAI